MTLASLRSHQSRQTDAQQKPKSCERTSGRDNGPSFVALRLPRKAKVFDADGMWEKLTSCRHQNKTC